MLRRRRNNRQQILATIVVKLDATAFNSPEADGAKWVQVTREGNFPGYMGGLKPFAFSRTDIEQMVANLKAHPSFSEGTDGVGAANVIPWDFNHASEANPTAGNLPSNGAPAQGWTLDFQVRTGADGKVELWALTNFLGVARGYVKAGQYQWASVAVTFNAIHPETAENIGTIVTSIAMTNNPFVEGMEKLVASRNGIPGGQQVDGQVELRHMFFEAARNPAQAISMMREMFALPETAGAAEVMGQVGIVAQWLASGTAPLGTDPEEIVGNLRIILNLPALTSQLDVLDEAGKSIQALLEEDNGGGMADLEGDDLVPEPADLIAASRRKEDDMDKYDKLIQTLASELGVSGSENNVIQACQDLGHLRTALVAQYQLSRDGNAVILAAAKDGAGAKEKLLGLFAALGVDDPEAALSKITKTLDDAKKLSEVMPELAELKVEKEVTEKASIEGDVDSAIAASKVDITSLRPTLLLQRTSDPEGFAKQFPKGGPAAPAKGARPDLTRRVAASGATPLRSDGTKITLGAAPMDAPPDEMPDNVNGKDTINLAMYGGPNPTACAKLHLAATHVGYDKLTLEQKHTLAVNFKKQGHVFHTPQAVN